jgi:hypothetical protein
MSRLPMAWRTELANKTGREPPTATPTYKEHAMNTLERFGLGMTGLVLLCLGNMACANTATGKVTYYVIWPNTSSTNSDSYYGVSVGGNKVATPNGTMGELLHEAFMRKLTVTVEFTPCFGPPPLYMPCFGTITSAVIQSSDLP